MEVSLGFIALFLLVLFPGLIFRKLYFHGEFSKQFSAGYNLISLIAISVLPGLINLVCIFFFYDNFISEIDLGIIIDKFKQVGNPDFLFTESDETPIKELINSNVSPFIIFLYTSSILFGSILGRLVRMTQIDTKIKILRFKNYWFYLFNGHHTNFKKMKHLKLQNKRHLFTKADILIDSANKTHLYSGIVVDYELENDNCQSLSKVMLQSAERYSVKNQKREKIAIPGNLLVVECESMKNINLTYIYEEAKDILKSMMPTYIELSIALLSLLLIPLFIFQFKSIDWEIYNSLFKLNWFARILAFILCVQVINLANPFFKKEQEYEWISNKNFNIKLIVIIVFQFLLWLFA